MTVATLSSARLRRVLDSLEDARTDLKVLADRSDSVAYQLRLSTAWLLLRQASEELRAAEEGR